MGTLFTCSRCGNADPRYIGFRHGEPYCRKCVTFKGNEALVKEGRPGNVALSLSYRLSRAQETLSKRIIENFEKGVDTLVYAVCGSGKTEISYGVIALAMSRGLKVGFALPRRDVVIELFYRLRDAFPSNRIVAVYGQHTGRLEGDCIILTTHQLYRYPDYFDLLVMDEIDAFPFKGNAVLISLYKRSVKGHVVMMSATPSDEIRKEFRKEGHSTLELHTRFHKRPIPVPEVMVRHGIMKEISLLKLLNSYKNTCKPCLIFVATVDKAESLFRRLSPFVPGGDFVSSKRMDRDRVIKRFKEGITKWLVSTAVLERGVTIRDVQVVIFGADDERIYDSAALIQISGRAGRKSDAPTGDVFFIADKETEAMRRAINEIEFCNSYL